MQVPVAEHFGSPEDQVRAARMGMWIFLATEILLFTGLFVCYAAYRFLFPQTFALGAQHMEVGLGTLNTLVLLTSSLTVALALHFTKVSHRWLTVAFLLASVLIGGAFLVIKGLEYSHHFAEGAYWGKHFRMASMKAPGSSVFFTLYYAMTGLHAVHVIAGMSVLSWLTWRAARGDFDAEHHTALELGGMYWHLVDIIWLFLYPLLYLIT